SNAVQQALERHEPLAKELHERAVSHYGRLQAFLDKTGTIPTQTTMSWRAPFGRRAGQPAMSAKELLDCLQTYAKARYQSLVLHHVTGLYVSLRGYLSEQLREIGFCRTRLLELAQLVVPTVEEGDGAEDPRTRCLLPDGLTSLDSAVQQIQEKITDE